jgi:hypothetical protein
MPEDKHIYTSSRWVKFLNKTKSAINSIKNVRSKLLRPKHKVVVDLTKPIPEPQVKRVPPKQTKTPSVVTQKSALKSQPKSAKKIEIPRFSFKLRIRLSESGAKILVYTLVFAIIAIIVLGTYLSLTH